jgi:hypothetical protein
VFACPCSISCWATNRTVSLWIAKPTPTFASTVPPWIWELTPITSPRPSSSGPPELPWLIGASVWTASLIVPPLGDWMSRPVALTIPAVIVRSSPNGLPIAYAASPTVARLESSNVSGCRADAGAFTCTTARSDDGSVPTTVAGYVAPPLKPTRMPLAPATTWSLVTMSSPLRSITKPDPSAFTCCLPGGVNRPAGSNGTGTYARAGAAGGGERSEPPLMT